MKLNKHGLSRSIPPTVKSEVRKRCAFGCVLCGSIPYDYDHFIVPWAEAKEHDPDDIVLLCDKHHRQKTAGLIDTDTIRTALKLRQSATSEFRFKLDGTSEQFAVHWPHNDLSATLQGIVVDGSPILQIEPQDNPLEPLLVSGAFTDMMGQEICVIERNEFVSRAALVGDFQIVGNRFSYRSIHGQKCLQFLLSPAGITIEHLFHVRGDAFVLSMSDHLLLGNLTNRIRASGNYMSECEIAIELQSSTDSWDFLAHDITQLPGASSMVGCSMIRCRSGLFVAAPPRYRPTYSFGGQLGVG